MPAQHRQELLVSNLHTVGTDRDHAVKKQQAALALAELTAHEHRVRTWLNSSDPTWARKPPGHESRVDGSCIDEILTTPMRVSERETVARQSKKGRIKGVVPSDHPMVRATVWLP